MERVKLGNYAHVSISVRNLTESIPFYEKLGFAPLYGSVEPHPWKLLTDGRLNIHLYQFDFPSPALHYFSDKMKDKVLELLRAGIKPEHQKSKDGNRAQHTFYDPNEFSIMLMHHSDADMPRPNGLSRSRLGVFGELCISTDNLNASAEFWKKLEFSGLNEGTRPYPWMILSDGTMTISMHQTESFSEPALLYYADGVAERIKQLKADSFVIQHELKDADGFVEGAILHAPDGQRFILLDGFV